MGERPAPPVSAERTPGAWAICPHPNPGFGRGVVAVDGDEVRTIFDSGASEADARLMAASPALLDSLLAVEWAGEMEDDESGDPFECCPNCFAVVGDAGETPRHYTHCELRDALDAALGVESPRVIHPARANG